MISLLNLKQKLKQNKMITLAALSRHFKTNLDELLPMLDMLTKKGYICEVETPDGCGTTCTQCTEKTNIIYQWIEK
jgi:hypothetical protein